MLKYTALALVVLAGCASRPGAYNAKPVITRDDDRHPITKPETYWSSNTWDGIDTQVFNRLSKTLAIETFVPSVNVNALDEVPDSSWFNNRIGQRAVSPERVARGACPEGINLDGKTLTAKSAKVDGVNPGFVIEDDAHNKYLLKFDTNSQPERGTAADVMGSRIYWAFGYNAPCNFMVFFDRSQVQLADDATKTDSAGKKTKLTEEDIDSALAKAWKHPDGRLRGSASVFIEGEPIGPWRYEGLRKDDLNDVVPHEDRRELRAQRVINAWLDHYDARDGNTFATFIKTDGDKGYVKHYMVDFGDCLGSAVASKPEWSRRLGRQYYLDWGDVGTDLISLGLRTDDWERVSIDPAAPQLGYYEDRVFAPADWKPGYPNGAFLRMDDKDAFWGAQIVARFSDGHLDALLDLAQFAEPAVRARLRQVLIGRRNRIVRDYIYPYTALTRAAVTNDQLCFEDVLVAMGHETPDSGFYEMRGLPLNGTAGDTSGWRTFQVNERGQACLGLDGEAGLTIEARVRRAKSDHFAAPVRFHIAGGNLIGVERLHRED